MEGTNETGVPRYVVVNSTSTSLADNTHTSTVMTPFDNSHTSTVTTPLKSLEENHGKTMENLENISNQSIDEDGGGVVEDPLVEKVKSKKATVELNSSIKFIVESDDITPHFSITSQL